MRRDLQSRAGALGLLAALLAGAPAAAAELGAEELKEFEQALDQLAFDPGPIDGVVDDRTRIAIRLYQEFAALPVTGEPSAALLAEVRQVAAAFGEMRAQAPRPQPEPEPEPAPAAAPEPAPQPEAAPAPLTEAVPAPAPQPEPTPEPESASETQPEPALLAETRPQPDALPEPEPEPAALAKAKPEPTPEPAPESKLAPVGEAEPAPAPQPGPPPAAKRQTPAFNLDGVVDRLVKSAQKPSAEAPAPAAARSVEAQTNAEMLARLARASVAKAGAETSQPQTAAVPEAARPGDTERAPASAAAAAPTQSARAVAAPADGYHEYALGFDAAQAGHFDEAIGHYTRAIESGALTLQHLAQVLHNRANAYYYKGAYEQAIADYDAAIHNNPQFPGAFYNRGFAHQAEGDQAAAVADFTAARDLGWQRLGVRAPDIPPPRG